MLVANDAFQTGLSRHFAALNFTRRFGGSSQPQGPETTTPKLAPQRTTNQRTWLFVSACFGGVIVSTGLPDWLQQNITIEAAEKFYHENILRKDASNVEDMNPSRQFQLKWAKPQ